MQDESVHLWLCAKVPVGILYPHDKLLQRSTAPHTGRHEEQGSLNAWARFHRIELVLDDDGCDSWTHRLRYRQHLTSRLVIVPINGPKERELLSGADRSGGTPVPHSVKSLSDLMPIPVPNWQLFQFVNSLLDEHPRRFWIAKQRVDVESHAPARSP